MKVTTSMVTFHGGPVTEAERIKELKDLGILESSRLIDNIDDIEEVNQASAVRASGRGSGRGRG